MKEMNPVFVRVKGVQKTPDGEENTISTESQGRYIFRGGKHYVLYEEKGLTENGKVTATLKFDESKLTLLRHGAVEQTMEFLPRGESRSLYRTPIGNLSLAVRTEFLGMDLSTEVKKLTVEYSLAMEGVHQSKNSLFIEVSPLLAEND
ncbi:MAG: DUF1934 domain-containing protein [Selenomonas ruminantium]|nr:DUF1934 domain-containing protein [Selenomonas ruminantium]